MEELQYKEFLLTLSKKSLEDSEAGHFEGYLSVFNVVDKQKDIVGPGAWHIARTPLPVIYRHNRDEILGEITEFKEDDVGLFVKGDLDLNVSRAREIHSLMKKKLVNYMSPGYITRQDTFEGNARRILVGDVYECSLTPWPANEGAAITEVKEDGLILENIGEELSKMASVLDTYSTRLGWNKNTQTKEDDSVSKKSKPDPIKEVKPEEPVKKEVPEPVKEEPAKAAEPKAEEPKAEEPKAEEPVKVEEPVKKEEPVKDIPVQEPPRAVVEPEPDIPIEQTPEYAKAAEAVYELLEETNVFKAKLDALSEMVTKVPEEVTPPVQETKEEKGTPTKE